MRFIQFYFLLGIHIASALQSLDPGNLITTGYLRELIQPGQITNWPTIAYSPNRTNTVLFIFEKPD